MGGLKIFIITSGSYSDYSIEAVFTEKGLAQKYIEHFGSEECHIEEYNLDPYGKELKEGKEPFYVYINKQGDVSRIWQGAECPTSMSFKKDRPNFDYNKDLIVFCMAMDPQHAAKIANEKRTQVLTNGWDSKALLKD